MSDLRPEQEVRSRRLDLLRAAQDTSRSTILDAQGQAVENADMLMSMAFALTWILNEEQLPQGKWRHEVAEGWGKKGEEEIRKRRLALMRAIDKANGLIVTLHTEKPVPAPELCAMIMALTWYLREDHMPQEEWKHPQHFKGWKDLSHDFDDPNDGSGAEDARLVRTS